MPVPNVYTATEDPTSQVGNDGDIYFHTGLIGLSAINVYKKVSGRWGLTGSISTANGFLLSANIARVDPSGSDSTGMVGDPSKPFLTVQGAINGIEAGSFDNPLIELGTTNYFEDVTTSLDSLTITGPGVYPFNSLTFTGDSGKFLQLFGVINPGAITASTSGGLEVSVNASAFAGDVSNSSGNLSVQSVGAGGCGTISAPGFQILLYGMQQFDDEVATINSAGSDVTAYSCVINLLSAASSILLHDSRIITNNAGITPTYTDVLLNPAGMDFSTLPQQTDESGLVAGQAWIDTTAGLNIIKVKL